MHQATIGPVLAFGAFELDVKSGQLRKSGVRLKLRPQAVRVLALLASRSGDLVTREEIRKEIWADDLVVDFDQGLNFCIRQVRSALADNADAPRFIETVPRSGYRFLVPVQVRGTAPSSDPVPAAAAPDATEVAVTGGEVPALAPAGNGLANRRKWRVAIALGCTAVVLLAAAVVLNGYRRQGLPPNSPIRSIAVLPLANLSGDPGQEFFADGMTEALIYQLSAVRDLRVVSRTSVMAYKQQPKPVRKIAEELKVDAVIEGSVQRSADRVRISVRMMRDSDSKVWSEVYERNLQDILSLQSELALAIARQIETRLVGQPPAIPAASRSVATDVYENYLKGRFQINKGGIASIQDGIKHLEEAIAADPAFAQAYSALALANSRLGSSLTGASPVSEAWPKALAAARKALELDPNSSEAHTVLALALEQKWEWAQAETAYRRALDLDPNNALALNELGDLLVVRTQTGEGLELVRRARDLDPLNLGHSARLGWLLYHLRRYDEAARELRSTLSVDPNHRPSRWFLGFVLIEKQQFAEAVQVLEQEAANSARNPAVLGILARAYARSGRTSEALRIVDELKRRRREGYVPPAPFVLAYSGLGDEEMTFTWLERAFEEHSNMVRYLRSHPVFDPLRKHPRFVDLLRRAGL